MMSGPGKIILSDGEMSTVDLRGATAWASRTIDCGGIEGCSSNARIQVLRERWSAVRGVAGETASVRTGFQKPKGWQAECLASK